MAIGGDAPESKPDRRIGKTRKALKEALTDLILERGYEAVTVQEVISRADVGRSTFYAHFVDKDALLMAILADLEMPGLDPGSWKPDDPAFGWTLALFRHFGSGKRLFKAVAGDESGSSGRSWASWTGGCATRTTTCPPRMSTMHFARSLCRAWQTCSS